MHSICICIFLEDVEIFLVYIFLVLCCVYRRFTNKMIIFFWTSILSYDLQEMRSAVDEKSIGKKVLNIPNPSMSDLISIVVSIFHLTICSHDQNSFMWLFVGSHCRFIRCWCSENDVVVIHLRQMNFTKPNSVSRFSAYITCTKFTISSVLVVSELQAAHHKPGLMSAHCFITELSFIRASF